MYTYLCISSLLCCSPEIVTTLQSKLYSNKDFFKKRKTSKFYFGSKSTKEKDIKKHKRAKKKDTTSSTYLTKRIPILK